MIQTIAVDASDFRDGPPKSRSDTDERPGLIVEVDVLRSYKFL